MKPFPNEMLFLVYKLTNVLSASSDVFVSWIGFYKVTTVPLAPLGLMM